MDFGDFGDVLDSFDDSAVSGGSTNSGGTPFLSSLISMAGQLAGGSAGGTVAKASSPSTTGLPPTNASTGNFLQDNILLIGGLALAVIAGVVIMKK
jgi:hypothetical protein